MTDAKTSALADKIAHTVVGSLKDILNRIEQDLATTLVRLAALEATTPAPESKRPVKTAAAMSPAIKKSAAGRVTKGAGDKKDPGNAMLFARHAMVNDPKFREEFGTDAHEDQAREKDASFAKLQKGTTADEKYYATLASACWKSIYTEDEKAKIKSYFATFKDERARERRPPSLDIDPEEGVVADGDMDN